MAPGFPQLLPPHSLWFTAHVRARENQADVLSQCPVGDGFACTLALALPASHSLPWVKVWDEDAARDGSVSVCQASERNWVLFPSTHVKM